MAMAARRNRQEKGKKSPSFSFSTANNRQSLKTHRADKEIRIRKKKFFRNYRKEEKKKKKKTS